MTYIWSYLSKYYYVLLLFPCDSFPPTQLLWCVPVENVHTFCLPFNSFSFSLSPPLSLSFFLPLSPCVCLSSSHFVWYNVHHLPCLSFLFPLCPYFPYVPICFPFCTPVSVLLETHQRRTSAAKYFLSSLPSPSPFLTTQLLYTILLFSCHPGILGNPAEVYQFGMMYMLYVVAATLGCLYGSLLFVPLLYPLKLTSSFEVS